MKIFGVLLLAFILVPVAEFALLIEIGKRIGTLETLALIFGTGIVGAWLARLEGFRILHEIRREMDAGRGPTSQMFDGLLVLVAAAVLITPGLLTDLAGLILLFPPTRKPIRTLVLRRLERWVSGRRVQVTRL